MRRPARQVAESAVATRIDRSTGIEEHARFLGPAGERIFSVLALPSGRPRGGVVIAPSLLTDRVRMYRDEVRVARTLAANGYAVQRFDYRGFGHSDGRTGVADLGSMLEDVAVAVQDLQNHVEGESVGLVGSRFGSAVITQTPLLAGRSVLWYPVLTGQEYFKLAFRGHMVGTMQRGAGESSPTKQLEDVGHANVLGYDVSRRLVEGVKDAVLTSTRWPAGSQVLWIESGSELSSTRQNAANQLRETGVDLSIVFAPTDDPGWFVGVRPFQNAQATDMLVKWFTDGGSG